MRTPLFLLALFALAPASLAQSEWDVAIWDQAVWDEAVAQYEVLASASEGGLIDPAGEVRASANEVLTFALTSDDGYELSSVDSTCGGAIEGSSFVTDPIVGNCSVNALFELIPPPQVFEITLSYNEGGEVSPSGSVQVIEGETQVFLISLNDNYEVKSVIGDCVASFDNTRIETVGLAADCSIAVTFGLISGSVPPSQPVAGDLEVAASSLSFSVSVSEQGSDPITSYTAACEIPDALEIPVATKVSSLTIGEVVELDLGAAKTTGSRGVYGLAVDGGLLGAKAGDSLIFPASGGGIVTLDIATRMVTKFGNVHFAGENGDLRFSLMMSPKGRLIGEYFDGTTSIEIRPDLSGRGHRLFVASEGAVLPIMDAGHIAKQVATHQEKPADSIPALGEIDSAFSVISLLILVDDDVYNSGDAMLFSDFFVTAANTAYIDTGVRIVLSLVGVERYQPDTGTDDQSGILKEITCGAADCDIYEPTYNEVVNNLRESYKADLVTQMVGFAQESSEGGFVCGTAWLPQYRESTFLTDLRYRWSYSLVSVVVASQNATCPANVVAHETGHNMGLLHDADNDPSGIPLVAGGRGFVLGDGLRGTIMSYPPVGFNGYVNLFSDPAQSFEGWPLGTNANPYPANAAAALNAVRGYYEAIFTNSNSELIPDAPTLQRGSQRGRSLDLFFEEITPPLGTPVDGNLQRRVLYAADCGGNNTAVGFSSPITLSGLSRGTSHTCVVYSLTDYAVSDASNAKTVFMEKLNYTIQASANDGGAISPSGSVQVEEGQSQTFSLIPDSGYQLGATVGGSCNGTLTGQNYTVSNVQSSCSVVANFEEVKEEYQVTPSASVGGSISPDTPQQVTEGSAVSFELRPDDGFSIAPVGGSCGGSLDGTVFTTSPVTADCSVEAMFQQDQPQSAVVSANVIGEGSLSPSFPISVSVGESLTVGFDPADNYRLASVSGCNGQFNGQTFEIASVTNSCELDVVFSRYRWVEVSEEPNFRFVDLPPATSFECYVTAQNLAGNSIASEVFSFQTLGSSGDRDSDGVPDEDDAFPDEPVASVDSDGDGLPDAWNDNATSTEIFESGLTLDEDDDNDGYTDAEELEEGTDPLSPDSYPEIPRINIFTILKAIMNRGAVTP